MVASIKMLLGQKALEIFDSSDGLFDRRQAIIWNIVDWTFKNKLQWNLNQDRKFFIQEIAFENAILSLGRWVKTPRGRVV